MTEEDVSKGEDGIMGDDTDVDTDDEGSDNEDAAADKDGVDQCEEEFKEGEVSTSLEPLTSTSAAVFYLKWSQEGSVGGPRGGVVRMYGPEGRHYFYSLQVHDCHFKNHLEIEVLANRAVILGVGTVVRGRVRIRQVRQMN